MTTKQCRDCLAEYLAGEIPKMPKRPALEQGPRCSSHWRQVVKERKAANHEKRVQRVYGLKAGEYAQLYRFQGGRCALCRRSTGASKKLAVDHNHATGAVRGLCCSICNKWILGHARDRISFFERCIGYLRMPPYEAMRQGWTEWYADE
ncbi:endonuclease VII domain-containing protein [Streptomyces sp. NPDC057854]|uniref:endonuclease VII domain-containing protein n=1 Tax=unclassified Streptomyces TaxID=2593676 RepID=UPI00367E4FE6